MDPEDANVSYPEDNSQASTSTVGTVESALVSTQTDQDHKDSDSCIELNKCTESLQLISRDESYDDDIRTYLNHYQRSRVYDDPSHASIRIIKESFTELHHSPKNNIFGSGSSSRSVSYREIYRPNGFQLLRERLIQEALNNQDNDLESVQNQNNPEADWADLSYISNESPNSLRVLTLENYLRPPSNDKPPFVGDDNTASKESLKDNLQTIACSKEERKPYKVEIVPDKDDCKKKSLVLYIDISDVNAAPLEEPPCCPPPLSPPCCGGPPPPSCIKEPVMAIKKPTCPGERPCYYLTEKSRVCQKCPPPPCCNKPEPCPPEPCPPKPCPPPPLPPCCPSPPPPPSCPPRLPPPSCLPPPPPPSCPTPPLPPCCPSSPPCPPLPPPCPPSPCPPIEEPAPPPPSQPPETQKPCKPKCYPPPPPPKDWNSGTVQVDPYERLYCFYEKARDKSQEIAAVISKEMCRQLRLCDDPSDPKCKQLDNGKDDPKKGSSSKAKKCDNSSKPVARKLPCLKTNRLRALSNENCRKPKPKAGEKCKSCAPQRSAKEERLARHCIKEDACRKPERYTTSEYTDYNKYDMPTPRPEPCQVSNVFCETRSGRPHEMSNVFPEKKSAVSNIFTTIKSKIFEMFGDPDAAAVVLSTHSLTDHDLFLMHDGRSDDSFTNLSNN